MDRKTRFGLKLSEEDLDIFVETQTEVNNMYAAYVKAPMEYQVVIHKNSENVLKDTGGSLNGEYGRHITKE